MKYLLIVCAFLYSLTDAVAADQSALQEQYISKFSHAVELLNDYRGNTPSLDVAQAELRDVLKENPRYAPAYREVARYFIMRGYISYLKFQPGSLEAADSSLNKAIEINPNYAEAYVLRGHLYRLMERHQDAVAALETAEKLGTTDPWLQNNWADLLIDEGKYEEAAKRYRKVIDSNTSNKKALDSAFNGLIRYYKNLGNLEKVDETYRTKIDFEPNSAWNYGNYAQFLLCEKDDFNSSIVRSREALRIMDYGVGRYWLGAALYRKWAQNVLNRTASEGEQYFSEAQKIIPDPHEVADDINDCPPLNLIFEALRQASQEHNAAPQGPPMFIFPLNSSTVRSK